MDELKEAGRAWASFSADREEARVDLLSKQAEIEAEIAKLRAEKASMDLEFQAKWKAEKERRRQAQDAAATAAFADGRSAQEIMRQLGTYNTQWIYGLRSSLVEAGVLEPKTKGKKEQEEVEDHSEEAVADATTGLQWMHHDHKGVHGYLIDVDSNYIKKYGAPGTDFEGEFFIVDREHEYVSGSMELFKNTPYAEFHKRVLMLQSLLDGTYTARVLLEPNPYRK